MVDEDSDEFIALDAQVTGHVSDNALKTWKRIKQEMRDLQRIRDAAAKSLDSRCCYEAADYELERLLKGDS